MSMLNWNIFNLKFDQRQTTAFEDLAYLLFCAEFDNRIGLFRYKNQTGLETEPINKNGILYGFQAKYYTTPISQNKNDIIDSILKSKEKNENIKELYLYINEEFSESSKPECKKPKYQTDIEKEATKVDVILQWRVKSHFEVQLSLPENKYIYDLFFSLEPDAGDLIEEIKKHTHNILKSIHTNITFKETSIHINRDNHIVEIQNSVEKGTHLVISGEGGCGKTAIFKDFHDQIHDIPICLFKASELNTRHVNDLFRFDHSFSFNQFLETFSMEKKKLFVIDSAEKLIEASNFDIVTELINSLKDNNWIIIFTTRYSYLNDLKFQLEQTYQLQYKEINIPLLKDDELEDISKKYDFSLPVNLKFRTRLKNLFYLSEYIREYSYISKSENVNHFIDLIWKKRIQNITNLKDNIHLQREHCFLQIVKERCEKGLFYINGDNLPQSALAQLRQDDILGYDDTFCGYFITHDIYEEWALERIIEKEFRNNLCFTTFFSGIGTSLTIRRAFRLWLSDKMQENIASIKNFITESFTHNDIPPYWKDEILVSILLSTYSDTFFEQFENEIRKNDFELLKKIIFLLQVACEEINNKIPSPLKNKEYIYTIPKGNGWNSTIKFIDKFKKEFAKHHQAFIIPLLKEWIRHFKKGHTSKLASSYALFLYKNKETSQNRQNTYYPSELEEEIVKLIFDGVNEINENVKELFELILNPDSNLNHNSFHDFKEILLSESIFYPDIIHLFPTEVISLCDSMWYKPKNEEYPFGHFSEVEDAYSISFNTYHMSVSALQTPIFHLLHYATSQTIDFILVFVNKTVSSYSKSGYDNKLEEIYIEIDDHKIKQFISPALWEMYRGTGSPCVPKLMQCIHMALEKYLLYIAASSEKDELEQILKKLLKESCSSSITSIVCSIVLAYPSKLYKIALILFKTYKLFNYDKIRLHHEKQTKYLYTSFGSAYDEIYTKERLKTCDDKHRKLTLEFICLKMQYNGVEGYSEEISENLIQDIYKIIDSYHDDTDLSLQYLIARLDRRTLKPKITKTDQGTLMELIPQLDAELKVRSEKETELLNYPYKYISLKLWSDFLKTPTSNDIANETSKYDKDIHISLKETKEIIDELNSECCTEQFYIANYSIPGFVCSKLFINFRNTLNQEEKDFCADIIKQYLYKLLFDNYDYQIGDGVEAAVHSLPYLLEEYPADEEQWLGLFIITLFDNTSLGQYKKIYDYALDSIANSNLWENQFEFTYSVLASFVKMKPLFDRSLDSVRSQNRFHNHVSIESVYKKFDSLINETFGNIKSDDLTFNDKDLKKLSISDLNIIIQLIPEDTTNDVLKNIIKSILPNALSDLLKDKRKKYEDHDWVDYTIYQQFYKKIAGFLLFRDINELDVFIELCTQQLNTTEETADFLKEIVSMQNEVNRYDQFWKIWNSFLPTYLKMSKDVHSRNFNKITHSYLLESSFYTECKEWHSLKITNILFYKRIAEETGNPIPVLYSICKVLDSIGSNFIEDGITWINSIINKNEDLKNEELEINTIYYMERIMRKYIYMQKENIKRNPSLKTKTINILNFLVHKASVRGYLLREEII